MADQKSGLLYENLRKLINTIDELRDVGLQEYINLPRIAVVGTQSAGKSSLLESIVGMDFLPRGEGVVTRRPLELRLIHVSFGGSEFKPYAVFPPEEEKYYDFSKVYLKIQELTDKVCGTSKDIVDNPITMKIYSQTCPDLTLIDLPGITRIPMAGQSKDIEKITKGMCRRYGRDDRTIILAVVPANADMSTSDALLLANEEDPDGIRTIGVITKIDIMDKGTNAKKMLLGQEIPLRLGYVGVKGRSQLDIQNNMKVIDALKAEKEFFQTHPAYSTLPPGIVGTEALTAKLTKVLFGHIRATLPDIVKEIQIKIKECEERLRDLGEPLPSTTKEKMQLVWNMCTDYVENFKNNIRGKFDQKRNAKVIKDFSGGAKIKMMFQDLYKDFFGKTPTEHITDEQIRRAIVLHQGDSIPGFPSLDSFLFLLGPLLKKLKDPAYELLNNVHLYLEELSSGLVDKIFFRFPNIIDEIHEITNKALKDERDVAQTLIENIIESEQAYIFTNDIAYMTEKTSMNPVVQQMQQQQTSTSSTGGPNQQQNQPPPKKIDPEKIIVDEIRSRIDSYFCIVLRNIRDSIPKVIGHFLVKAIQENLQYCLYNELNKSENIMASIGEPPHITAERETLNKVLEVLQRAKRVLTKDPDLAPQFNDPKLPSSNTKITNSASEKSSNVTTHSSRGALEESKTSKDDLLGPMTTSTTVTNPNLNSTTTRQTNSQTTTTTNPTKEVFGDSLNKPFPNSNPSQGKDTSSTISTTSSGGSTTTDKSSSNNGGMFGSTTQNTQQNPSGGQNGGTNPFGNKPTNPPPKKSGLFG